MSHLLMKTVKDYNQLPIIYNYLTTLNFPPSSLSIHKSPSENNPKTKKKKGTRLKPQGPPFSPKNWLIIN